MPDNNTATPITNPLQTNNTAVAIISYAAGIAAAKLPIFDLSTWNYIFMSAGGIVFAVWSAYSNRKSAVVATVAQMPEVAKVELDKTVATSKPLCEATPDNVVVK